MNWNELLCSDRIRSVKPKKASADMRSEFEKDYHRIIGSASFRRLQDKTQVFPLDKSDFIRTRLTHSLEVSSFAKSLGQYVGTKMIEENVDANFTITDRIHICDILECAGLLHDIGNPPFGHFGEELIRQWFAENLQKLTFQGNTLESILDEQMKEDFLNFEGNTQALRVVTKLHYLVDEHGMNLNKALLGTIIKYPVASTEINKKSGNVKDKKMGYYYADREVFQSVITAIGTDGHRHPLTFLLEAADDIAYTTADIEDSIKKGCIRYAQLLDALGQKFGEEHFFVTELKRRYTKAISAHNDEPDLYAVQNWLVAIQGRAIYAAGDSFLEHYTDIMEGSYGKALLSGTYMEDIMELLGELAYREVFQSKAILKLEISAATIIYGLLDQFMGAIVAYDTEEVQTKVQEKLVKLISQNYIRIYQVYAKDKTEQEKLYLRLLLVTDFICGMTDSYAKILYEELNGNV
ncbi:MAG: deoxyguanosinetriphosphate triphosphohydrolase [Eubacteriales bacterium]